MKQSNAVLVLESGIYFRGKIFGYCGETYGEVVFNTAIVGYEEVITDPSYKGQIVVMTYPHIGNYGLSLTDVESRQPWIEGFVVNEYSRTSSNYRARSVVEEFFKKYKVVGIENVDTRALTRYIRDNGSMRGIISNKVDKIEELVKKVKSVPKIEELDLVREVSCKEVYLPFKKEQTDIALQETEFYSFPTQCGYKVVVIDCGCKYNILRSLRERGCEIVVVPPDTPYKKILDYAPDGIFLSNGPGDPQSVPYVFKTVEKIIDYEISSKDYIPIFGICLGHQMLGLAFGGKTKKLKFGHHGINHPVKNLNTGIIEITSQNHNFVVEYKQIKDKFFLEGNNDIEITHLNLNDFSCEGLRHTSLPIFSVQYHPESAPGPNDSKYLFSEFVRLMKDYKKGKK